MRVRSWGCARKRDWTSTWEKGGEMNDREVHVDIMSVFSLEMTAAAAMVERYSPHRDSPHQNDQRHHNRALMIRVKRPMESSQGREGGSPKMTMTQQRPSSNPPV